MEGNNDEDSLEIRQSPQSSNALGQAIGIALLTTASLLFPQLARPYPPPYPGVRPPYPGGQHPYPGLPYPGGQFPYPGVRYPYPGAQPYPYSGAQLPYPGVKPPYPGAQYPYPGIIPQNLAVPPRNSRVRHWYTGI